MRDRDFNVRRRVRLASVGLLVVGLCVVVVLAVSHDGRTARERRDLNRCMANVREIVALDLQERRTLAVRQSGAVQLLYWRRKRMLSDGALVCPGAPGAADPLSTQQLGRYETVDFTRPELVPDLVTYAFRDVSQYPWDPMAERPEWIVCDRDAGHHSGGLVVGFDDGSVRFMDRAALGLAPHEPIIVGPESPHPELRKFRFVGHD